MSVVLMATLTKNRKLDQGNANKATIAEDFGRIGMSDFWDRVAATGGPKRTKTRLVRLDQLNLWRNAIAHNNFEQYRSRINELDGRLRPRLAEAQKCRAAVDQLATQLSESVAAYLGQLVGTAPW
ncbi:MAG: hypothetical protein JNM69_41460 [Archangium sp.]|nr:hypothetical protein [Archangium sp.]